MHEVGMKKTSRGEGASFGELRAGFCCKIVVAFACVVSGPEVVIPRFHIVVEVGSHRSYELHRSNLSKVLKFRCTVCVGIFRNEHSSVLQEDERSTPQSVYTDPMSCVTGRLCLNSQFLLLNCRFSITCHEFPFIRPRAIHFSQATSVSLCSLISPAFDPCAVLRRRQSQMSCPQKNSISRNVRGACGRDIRPPVSS
jgi:hypothetical protein